MKFLTFEQFLKEAVLSGQMSPNISFAPNIAFVPMSENPTPDPAEVYHLNMRVKNRNKTKRKNNNA
jgi:hypothetical protein